MKKDSLGFGPCLIESSDPSIQARISNQAKPQRQGHWRRGKELHTPTSVTEKPQLNNKVTKSIFFSEKQNIAIGEKRHRCKIKLPSNKEEKQKFMIWKWEGGIFYR